jgi:putative component of membrane protein insertase Oxa1/YidC/SpoIIIJ protein YidD
MQTSHQGLISTTLEKLIPLSHWLEKIGFRLLVIQSTTYAIRDYQRYISPNKGFSCAHRNIHGGTSCSEHFRLLVTSYGLSEAVPLFQRRLEDCRLAYKILKMSISKEGLGGEAEAEIDAEQTEETQQTQKASESESTWVDWCGGYGGNCSCGDAQTPLWGPCDSNHNGVFDLGDCSGIPTSCDGIDVGGCDCNL